ncbi:MAG: hypothetical protein KKA19_08475 [Candidatus Margulisbacteria bacterium]|nr:hypothetical protein [Candidatus Margulisiibacteriota bacterium]
MSKTNDFMKKSNYLRLPNQSFWQQEEIGNGECPIKFVVKKIGEKGSPEDKAYDEYIKAHRFLPKNPMAILEQEIKEEGEKLLCSRTNIKDKKKILIILAHHGSEIALDYLEKYEEQIDPELEYWVEMAIDECELFLEDRQEQKKSIWN